MRVYVRVRLDGWTATGWVAHVGREGVEIGMGMEGGGTFL